MTINREAYVIKTLMKSAGLRDVEASLRRIETTRSSGIESSKSDPALVSGAEEMGEEETHRRRFRTGAKMQSPAPAE